MESVSRTKFRLKTVVLFLVLSLVGLATLLWSLQLAPGGYPAALLKELSTVLLVGGTLGVLSELVQRRDFLDAVDERSNAILAKLELANQAEEMGLTESRVDGKFDFRDMIENSQRLMVAMNDGRTWVSTNSAYLKKRLADPQKSTLFFVVHPASPLVDVLARKEGSTPDGLRHKLTETLVMLSQLRTPQSKLTVLGHHLFNPHSLFVGDGFLILTPYFHSRGRRSVPYYRFEDRGSESYFRELESDLEGLRLDAEDVTAYRFGP